MGKLDALAGASEDHPMLAHDVAATQRGKADISLAPRPDIAIGTQLTWLVPALDVRMVDEKRDNYTGRENIHTAQIEAVLPLGGQATVRLRMSNGECLSAIAMMHVVHKRVIAPGSTVDMSLSSASIHLMPDDAQR